MNKISDNTGDNAPRLWVRRLMIFESSENRESPLRDIPFHRGINIIWGVELSDDAGSDEAHPVTLAGHSVGKTTLCRLIRYCLGESTYGNRAAMDRIRSSLPQGLVGLDIILGDQSWSVIRPFNTSKNSKALRDRSITELFDARHKDCPFHTFTEEIHRQLIVTLPADRPPGSEKPYEWKHLLGWLARDQEARFQSLHEWRSTRSASDTPRFDKPKEDPLHLIRVVLGLVNEEENRLATTTVRAENELKEIQANIAETQRAPALALASQERQIKGVLGLNPDQDFNLAENDLTSPILSSRELLQLEIRQLQSDIKDIDESIADGRYWLAWYNNEQGLQQDAIRITADGTEPPQRRNAENETIQKLREISGRECIYGNIPFDNCDYVKKHRDDRRQLWDFQQIREDRRVASVTAERAEALQQMQIKREQTLSLLRDVAKSLQNNVSNKAQREQELNRKQFQLHSLNSLLTQRRQTLELIEGRVANSELEHMNQRERELKNEIERDKGGLQRLQEAHTERVTEISRTYDRLVKGSLSNTYTGILKMTKGEFEFEIAEATGLSGEAVETLALVLADLTALVCSCNGVGHHPRFLMHDSPREADLDRHIYNRYLQMMMDLTNDFGGPDVAPFQYIVTTTSAPPSTMEPAISVRLKGRPEAEMLFGRSLRNATIAEHRSLFDNPSN